MSALKELQSRVLRFAREYREVAAAIDGPSLVRYSGAIALAAPAILKTRLLAPADDRMATTLVKVRDGGHTYRIPGKHFGLIREIYCRRVYNYVDGFEIRPGDQVVDLGANVGAFTVRAAVAGAKVLAIEAQDGFADEFWELMRENGVTERVTLVNGLVGASVGKLADPAALREASHLRHVPKEVALEALLDEHGFDRVDLLKLDIEGSEFDVIAHADAWLGKVQKIVMEVHAHFGDSLALARRLEDAGFRVTRVDPAGKPVAPSFTGDSFMFCRR